MVVSLALGSQAQKHLWATTKLSAVVAPPISMLVVNGQQSCNSGRILMTEV